MGEVRRRRIEVEMRSVVVRVEISVAVVVAAAAALWSCISKNIAWSELGRAEGTYVRPREATKHTPILSLRRMSFDHTRNKPVATRQISVKANKATVHITNQPALPHISTPGEED